MPTPLFGGKSPEALPWHPLPYMQEFLDNLAVDERSPTYIRSVKLGLTRFALFLEGEGVRHPDEITRAHILRYQAHLLTVEHEGEQLTIAYRQQLMKYARAWINWLERIQHIDGNPWIRIRVGKSVKRPKPLEDDEVEALFAAHRQQAFTMPPFYFHRREVIITLLLGWGLRLHELVSLNVSQMDMRLDWVTVLNKGGGSKTLPFADVMKGVILRYSTHRAKYDKLGEDALLIGEGGRRITKQRLYMIVTDLGDRAGVDLNPHRLRDTFGTTMLDYDVPVERIMKIFGHTKREQTLAYSRVNEPKVKESHDLVMQPLLNKLLGGELP